MSSKEFSLEIERVVSGLEFIVEKIDPYLSGHQKRVAALAAAKACVRLFREKNFRFQ